MFWKKKHKSEFGFSIESDKRRAFRLKPPPEAPLTIVYNGRPYMVVDISAGGAAFTAPPGVRQGQTLTVRFRLPFVETTITADIELIRVADNLAMGVFEGLTKADEEKIHRYILECQKLEMRKKIKAKKDRPDTPAG